MYKYHIILDSNECIKDKLPNPLFMIRSNKPIIAPRNETENQLLANAYILNNIGRNLPESRVANKEPNDYQRRVHTPQSKCHMLQFPFNAKKSKLLPDENNNRIQKNTSSKRKHNKSFINSSDQHDFRLFIHRVVIRQKEPQKRKVPMVIQKQPAEKLIRQSNSKEVKTAPEPIPLSEQKSKK